MHKYSMHHKIMYIWFRVLEIKMKCSFEYLLFVRFIENKSISRYNLDQKSKLLEVTAKIKKHRAFSIII